MAKTTAPHTGGSQFYIVPSDSTPSHLDGVHTVYGTVTEGLEFIDEISKINTDGEKPVSDVKVVSIVITDYGLVESEPWYQFW